MKLPAKFLDKTTIIIIIVSVLFGFWLMFHTFSYNQGSILIAAKAWSDFAAHIPLIRSFSLGANFPPEYPIFSGEPIKYHFLFYFFVGLLEKAGLRLDFALNIPSALSFAFLMIVIYYFAKTLFQSKAVGILALIFFLFNGSLSFLDFFKTHPLSLHSFQDIISNNTFPSFGPYDGKTISAFWNLNIYTNQRHLAGGFALSLILIYALLFPILKDKKPSFKFNISLGIISGLSFFFHNSAFLITTVISGYFLIIFSKIRLAIFVFLLISFIIVLPQYLFLQSGESVFKISFVPGYLISHNLSFSNFLNYWFANLGLHFLLVPFAFYLLTSKLKKIFLSFLIIFLIGNLFQFTPDMPTNHKFFNYFAIGTSLLSAYFLVYLWKKSNLLKPAVIILFFFLTFSGFIDFFPILNDSKIQLTDYPKNEDVNWIVRNTSPSAIFLNSNYLYNPASLAGRKIFLGWPYFSWGAGYNTFKRNDARKALFNPKDQATFCQNISFYRLKYVIIHGPNQVDDIELIINRDFFEKNLLKVYTNPATQLTIYTTSPPC